MIIAVVIAEVMGIRLPFRISNPLPNRWVVKIGKFISQVMRYWYNRSFSYAFKVWSKLHIVSCKLSKTDINVSPFIPFREYGNGTYCPYCTRRYGSTTEVLVI